MYTHKILKHTMNVFLPNIVSVEKSQRMLVEFSSWHVALDSALQGVHGSDVDTEHTTTTTEATNTK